MLGDRRDDGPPRSPARARSSTASAAEAIPERQVGRELARRARDDVERAVRVAELALVHVGEAAVEREPIVASRGRRDEHLEDLGLPLRGAGLVVGPLEDGRGARARLSDHQELLDDLDGPRIVRGELERALARSERVEVAVQRVDEELRQLDLARRALHALALIAVERDDLGGPVGVALRAQEAGERAERAPVVGDELEHAPVQADGVLRRSEGLFLEQGPLAEQVELQRGVGALDAQVEQPAQVVAPVGLAQDAIERLHGDVVGLVLLDELTVDLHRLVDATHLASEHLGQLRAEHAELLATAAIDALGVLLLLALLGRPRPFEDLESGAERVDEPGPLAGGPRRRLESDDRPRASRSELEGPGGPGERGGPVLELLPGDLHQLVEQHQLVGGVAGVGQQDLVERGQTAPLLVLLVQRHERGGRAGVVGSHGEDALVGAERPLRRVEALGVDGGAAEAQVDLEVGVGRLVGGAREDLDEALPVAVLRVELGEPVVVADGDVAVAQDAQRLRVTGLQSEDAAPRAHRLGGIVETIGVDAPELLEDREARGLVGRELGAALEHVGDRREVLVALGLLLERVERGGRRGLLVEHALVQGHRLGAEVEALGRELGHLDPQFPALRPFGGRLGLLGEEIEERPVGAPLGVELLESIDRFPIRWARLRAASRTPRRRSARWRTDRATAAR